MTDRQHQLLSVALGSIVVLIPAAAQAQGLVRDLFRQPPPPYPGEHWQGLPAQQPLSRQQLDWLNQLSGGQDEFGNLNTPVPAQRIIPQVPPDGAYRYPMQWDTDRSIILQIQGGQIMRQDYVLPR